MMYEVQLLNAHAKYIHKDQAAGRIILLPLYYSHCTEKLVGCGAGIAFWQHEFSDDFMMLALSVDDN